MRMWLAFVMAILLVGFVGCGDDDDGPTDPGDTTPDPAYVGSSVCIDCHEDQTKVANADIVAEFLESGHPYKLNKVVGGVQPDYPFTPDGSFQPPSGYTWDDVTYVIGGYQWKARFIDSNGWIITGDEVQWNFLVPDGGGWTGYHSDEAPGTKPYDCGKCHTTGWQTFEENGGLRQDNLPGMAGTFAEPGIGCEACHGMGAVHAHTEKPADITVNTTSELCGNCHTRDSERRIMASGGFVRHHEQYDEFLVTAHRAEGQTCGTCHNPHASSTNDDVAVGTGVIRTCESCHSGPAANTKHNGVPGCTDCHMAKSTKSAAAFSTYQGDIAGHIWAINTDPVGKDSMWYTEDDLTFAKDEVTLDFACYGCHKDEQGVGGEYSIKSLDSLSAYAMGMHD